MFLSQNDKYSIQMHKNVFGISSWRLSENSFIVLLFCYINNQAILHSIKNSCKFIFEKPSGTIPIAFSCSMDGMRRPSSKIVSRVSFLCFFFLKNLFLFCFRIKTENRKQFFVCFLRNVCILKMNGYFFDFLQHFRIFFLVLFFVFY